MRFLWQHRNAHFHVAPPVDVKGVIGLDPALPDEAIAERVRGTAFHHLAREERVQTGPQYRSAPRIREAVKNDHRVRAFISGQVQARGKSASALEARADDILRKVAADMRATWLRVADGLIQLVWDRMYDGIQVDLDGLAAVRRAAREAPVVLVPSHKSHVDYLVLSQVFFRSELVPPHVAAGENLDFWPVGGILRRCGAFFLRRRFGADKLYATVFAAYVRRLLVEGHTLEFFIEGSRSRTGKLLPPKMGMLGMCAEPVLDGSLPDVFLVPVSIGYEKILEGGAYAKELAGGQKRRESMGLLVRSARLLASRCGRVYVDFDTPISLKEFARERSYALPRPPEAGPATRRLVQNLAHRITFGIQSVIRVTPTSVAALVLLSDVRQGLGEDELYEWADEVIRFLARCEARISRTLEDEDWQKALRHAVARFVRDRLLSSERAPDGTWVYRIEGRGRVALDYYKNNILHYFVPTAVVAAALLVAIEARRSHPGVDAVEAPVVRDWAQRISQLLKKEVSFRVGSSFEANFEEASAQLVEMGLLTRPQPNMWALLPERKSYVLRLGGLLAVFFEAYRVMGASIQDLGGPTHERRLLQAALVSARRRALDGRLLRAEAASQPTLRQALSLFLAEGAVVRGEGGKLLPGDPAVLSQLMGELDLVLRALTVR